MNAILTGDLIIHSIKWMLAATSWIPLIIDHVHIQFHLQPWVRTPAVTGVHLRLTMGTQKVSWHHTATTIWSSARCFVRQLVAVNPLTTIPGKRCVSWMARRLIMSINFNQWSSSSTILQTATKSHAVIDPSFSLQSKIHRKIIAHWQIKKVALDLYMTISIHFQPSSSLIVHILIAWAGCVKWMHANVLYSIAFFLIFICLNLITSSRDNLCKIYAHRLSKSGLQIICQQTGSKQGRAVHSIQQWRRKQL